MEHLLLDYFIEILGNIVKKKMIEWQLLWQNYKVNNIIYVHKKCELYKMIKLVTLIKHK